MSTHQAVDMTNATGGTGLLIDVASLLGNGQPIVPHAVAVADSSVTGGAVQLQSSADGFTWSSVGSPVALSAGNGVTLNSPGSPVKFVRATVTTPVAGGRCTVVITP